MTVGSELNSLDQNNLNQRRAFSSMRFFNIKPGLFVVIATSLIFLQTSVKAEELGNAVRTFLDDYSGAAGSYTIGAVIMNDESDDYEPPQDGSDVGVHVVTLDLDVQFNT